ncbi:hypothetical protein ACFV9C_11335 [Kribbella sp. NPDC059898]|uniref:hypothetical protein n=1 Tax=Kribbella sp. NPDC059898 TaxID=3346995 RepID=UPI003660B085
MEVTKPALPALRLEVTSGQRILLRQREQVVLLAKGDLHTYGLDVYRTGLYESPLPPLHADLVRREPSWTHRYQEWLRASEAGPLHAGSWALEARPLPAYSMRSDLVREYPAAYLDWFGDGWNGLLPLRELPPDDAGRVKAYRKQAADGTLPPVLLWWVSALDGWLVLDGHCRLVAAQAEGIEPPVVQLSLAMPPGEHAEVIRSATEQHEQTMASVEREVAAGRPGAERVADQLVRAFASLVSDGFAVRTRGWPLPGGVPEWDRLAAAYEWQRD